MMTGDLCVVCGNSRKKVQNFPTIDFILIKQSVCSGYTFFNWDPEVVKPHTRVSSHYFMNGDPINEPQASIDKQFASPIKKGSDRTTWAHYVYLRAENQRLDSRCSVVDCLMFLSCDGDIWRLCLKAKTVSLILDADGTQVSLKRMVSLQY